MRHSWRRFLLDSSNFLQCTLPVLINTRRSVIIRTKSALVTFILDAILRVMTGLRVTVDEDVSGLVPTQHGEPAYAEME